MMRKTILYSIFLMAFCIIPYSTSAKSNKKPFVIPELREWQGDEGVFVLDAQTALVIEKKSPGQLAIAQTFAQDLFDLEGLRLSIHEGKTKGKSIRFRIREDKQLGEEGYQIKIGEQIEVSAPTETGLYWATRTLLQLTEQEKRAHLPKGEIRDYPAYPVRGFMLDCARKFIPIDFLRDYVKIMSYYKMNTFQIHLNDNGFYKLHNNDWDKTYAAFRLECDTYPGLTAEDGHYTKEEFVALQQLGQSRQLCIIPEIDIPGHSLAFSHYQAELGSEKYGMDHLDLFNPKTYEFLDALFDEYLNPEQPVFIGDYVHIGTDEYSNEDQELVEKFRYFTDYYIKQVEKYGKKAVVWGALTHAQGETPVKSEDVLMMVWNNIYSQPQEMMDLGYDIITVPDQDVYIVPNVGYYHNFLDIERLYNNWIPSHLADQKFAEDHPQIKGGLFALWNDHVGNGISTKDIHYRVMPAIRALSTKMWTASATSVPYEEWKKKSEELSEAPAINLSGKQGSPNSLVLALTDLHPNASYPLQEIGYDYTVAFSVDAEAEDWGTVLLESPTAKFYLADPIRGQVGFSRDGYLYHFNYRIKPGQKDELVIQGNAETTRLFVNGKLQDELSIFKWNEQAAFDMVFYYTQTLVFPLQRSGSFRSQISDLKVYNYWVDPIL